MATSTAAPGSLETVRALVNTLDIDLSTDAISTPADLERWLRDAELIAPGVQATTGDVERAIAIREALRTAMAANHDDAPVPVDAVTTLSEAAERADLGLSMTPEGGWIARPRAGGVDGALGAVLVIVADAMADGSWRRLKVCVNDTCRWAFYDLSRARSGKWCSMQICGNRAKQQAWRARRETA